MVLHTLKHLLFTGRFFKIPKFMADTACKFIGYKLGRNYKKFPKKPYSETHDEPFLLGFV